ncbi:MAG: exopolysaccharide production protein [Naasia sp.]|nr:exopolysaccharide production protein [Naasia sp.]
MDTRQRLQRWWGTAALFTLFAGEAFRNTLSWYGFAAWAAVIFGLGGAILAELLRERPVPARSLLRSPAVVLLGAFVTWATMSLIWSDYRGATLLAVLVMIVTTLTAATLLATLGWRGVVDALLRALLAIVVLSLLFELIVALVGQPVLPVFPINVEPGGEVPASFYWSRAELFDGGRIQGILGNANLLGFVALLLVIVTGCLLAGGAVRRGTGWAAIILAAGTLALTRSSTVLAAALATGVVLLLAVLWRRNRIAGAVALVAAVTALASAGSVAAPLIVSASDDLTGRIDIWTTVGGLFTERPVLGWGWTSYWQPWVPLFQELAVRKGVVYLQAHNAYLDVAFQLGALGLLLFLGLVVGTCVAVARNGLPARADFRAGTRRLAESASEAPTAHGDWYLGRLLPGLLLAALLTQALAESRLLVEGNWALFCVVVLASAGAVREARGSTRPHTAG